MPYFVPSRLRQRRMRWGFESLPSVLLRLRRAPYRKALSRDRFERDSEKLVVIRETQRSRIDTKCFSSQFAQSVASGPAPIGTLTTTSGCLAAGQGAPRCQLLRRRVRLRVVLEWILRRLQRATARRRRSKGTGASAYRLRM